MKSVRLVLLDRDGALVEDVPDNADPDRVRPLPGAREALGLLRAHGLHTGVVTRQPGVARGLLSQADLRRVDERIDDLLGPFDVWAVCPHDPDGDCHCRAPRPGLVLWAAGRVCTPPERIAVIAATADTAEAAHRAGAHGILLPTPGTRPEETAAADHVAPDLLTAVRGLLTGGPTQRVLADEREIAAAFRPTEKP
ncbi:D-glycero-alpha-D-manno-heptose-1,7-bisphosphate 7-phosphatase [Streptomyces sp. NEAU-NA10]|uniref:D-glycero-alpha-D-manno-heptose-1,7-bisphosphate 7-phosphatase n=1 Tax=Streptomyces sp. NEAU-NA10 TaxID=3416050 RepID=UPI003CC61D8F